MRLVDQHQADAERREQVQVVDEAEEALALGEQPAAEANDEGASAEVLQPVEDELGLVAVQFAHLESHDPPGGVGEDAEGQHGVHAEGADGGEFPLLADQHRIVDCPLGGVFAHRRRIVDRDAHHLQTRPPLALVAERLEERDLAPAGLAPGGPEVEKERPSLPLRQPVHEAVGAGQCKVRTRSGMLRGAGGASAAGWARGGAGAALAA